MARPSTHDVNDWLAFATAEPATDTEPRDQMTTGDLAWLAVNFLMDPQKYESIRQQLASKLTTLQLIDLDTRQDLPRDIAKQDTFDWLAGHAWTSIQDEKLKDEKKVRKDIEPRLDIEFLIYGWEEAHLDLRPIRKALWKVIVAKILDRNFFGYPARMSVSLQRAVIRTHCGGEDAEFLKTIDSAEIDKIVAENLKEGAHYLNWENRPGVCTVVRNINTLRQLRIEENLRQCQLMIDGTKDQVLKKELDPLAKDLRKYRDFMRKWNRGDVTFDCEGAACSHKAEELVKLALKVSVLSDTCQARIKTEEKKRLTQRKEQGERLTLREKFREKFS